VRAAACLRERGWDIRAVRPPSVPDGTARLRISIHPNHGRETLLAAAEAVAAVIREAGFAWAITDLLILRTDTDAGKTTFALLWLAAFADNYEYWKPLETGESDTERVRSLVPAATVHEPLARFRQAVAPLLAARTEGGTIPPAET